MNCSVATSTRDDLDRAVDDAAPRLAEGLGGPPDLLLAFFTDHHTRDAEQLHRRLMDELAPRHLMGCPGSGVIGNHRELEGTPALTLWGARWPGAELVPFRLEPVDGRERPMLEGWPDSDGVPPGAAFVVLADPYTSPPEVLLSGFEQRFPGQVLVGGVASATPGAGLGRLFDQHGIVPEGLIGMAVGGSVQVDTVVSQGCRPVGHHFVVTQARQNFILGLGGQPALKQLRSVFSDADATDQQLMQTALHIGRVVDERKSHFEPGDLLVRNVLGIKPEEKSIAISDFVRPGHTVQFMVRDAAAARAELSSMLGSLSGGPSPVGALLFSCNGRGERFFGTPNHDIDGVHDHLGEVPTAGFFAAGEIGPVGGKPFLHGFTASIALFRERV